MDNFYRLESHDLEDYEDRRDAWPDEDDYYLFEEEESNDPWWAVYTED